MTHTSTTSKRALGLWLCVGLVPLVIAAGCSERRALPVVPPPPAEVTYEANIQPIFEERCVVCHSPANLQGNYDMTTYAGVLGPGSDGIPNAIAGDPMSLLVVRSIPDGNMNSFYGSDAEVDLVTRWVVEENLAER